MLHVQTDKCSGCGVCVSVCPTGAIAINNAVASINERYCNDCGRCLEACPQGAIVAKQEALPVVRVQVPPAKVAAPAATALSLAAGALLPRLVDIGVRVLDNWLQARLSKPVAGADAPAGLRAACPRPGGRRRQRRWQRWL